jgi:hypothetical protein
VKLLQLVRTFARSSLLLGLVSAFNVDDVYAQSKNRAAEEANQQRDQAERYLTEGQLDRAELAAMRAVELDKSSLTERARRVLVEVYLQRGELNDAEQNIRAVRDVPNLPLPALEWTVRALMRVEIERFEGAGDAIGAQSRLDGFPTEGLSTAEAEWASKMRARVALRGFEQRREIQAGREALAAALASAQATKDTQGVRWLVAAQQRLAVVELEWAGAYDAARADAMTLAAMEAVRQPDLLWAQLVIARLDARLAREGGDPAQARALGQALAGAPRRQRARSELGPRLLVAPRLRGRRRQAKAERAAELAAQLAAFWASRAPGGAPAPAEGDHAPRESFSSASSAGFQLGAGAQRLNMRAPSERLVNNAKNACSATWQDRRRRRGLQRRCSAITLWPSRRAARTRFTEHLVVGGGAWRSRSPLLSGGLAGEMRACPCGQPLGRCRVASATASSSPPRSAPARLTTTPTTR